MELKEEVREFIRTHNIALNDFGFVYLQLNKDVFFPNEVIVGNIIVYITASLPRSRVYLQLKGYELGEQESPASQMLHHIVLQKQSSLTYTHKPFSLNASMSQPSQKAQQGAIMLTQFTLHEHYKRPDEVALQLNSLPVVDESNAEVQGQKDIPAIRRSLTDKSSSNQVRGEEEGTLRKSETLINGSNSYLRPPQSEQDTKSVKSLGHEHHHKKNAIFRAQKRRKQKSNKLILFDFKLPVFEFRMKKIQPGVFCIPISFRLPMFIPGSFEFVRAKNIYKIRYIARALIEQFEDNYSEKVQKYGKEQEKVGGQFSEFKAKHLLKDTRDFFIREFNYTDEEIKYLQALRQNYLRRKSENQMASKRNIIKQTMEKRYKNVIGDAYSRSQSGAIKRNTSGDNLTGFSRMATIPAMHEHQFLQGGDLFWHDLTGFTNKSSKQQFKLKLRRCCCVSKEALSLTISMNGEIFEPADTVKVDIGFERQNLFSIVESVEVVLMQRVVIFHDLKRLHHKHYTYELARGSYHRREEDEGQCEINVSFKLQKLLSIERRLDFVNRHLKLDQGIPEVNRLKTIQELYESTVKSNPTFSKVDSKDYCKEEVKITPVRNGQDDQEDVAAGLPPFKRKSGISQAMSNGIRKIESLNFSTNGHIIKNEFLVSIKVIAPDYILQNGGEMRVPFRIRERKEAVLLKIEKPKLPSILGGDIFTMSGAAMKLDERYISVDSLMLQSSAKYIKAKT